MPSVYQQNQPFCGCDLSSAIRAHSPNLPAWCHPDRPSFPPSFTLNKCDVIETCSQNKNIPICCHVFYTLFYCHSVCVRTAQQFFSRAIKVDILKKSGNGYIPPQHVSGSELSSNPPLTHLKLIFTSLILILSSSNQNQSCSISRSNFSNVTEFSVHVDLSKPHCEERFKPSLPLHWDTTRAHTYTPYVLSIYHLIWCCTVIKSFFLHHNHALDGESAGSTNQPLPQCTYLCISWWWNSSFSCSILCYDPTQLYKKMCP